MPIESVMRLESCQIKSLKQLLLSWSGIGILLWARWLLVLGRWLWRFKGIWNVSGTWGLWTTHTRDNQPSQPPFPSVTHRYVPENVAPVKNIRQGRRNNELRGKFPYGKEETRKWPGRRKQVLCTFSALLMLVPDSIWPLFAVFGNALEKMLCTSELKLPSQH